MTHQQVTAPKILPDSEKKTAAPDIPIASTTHHPPRLLAAPLTTPQAVISLQRVIGNRAVMRQLMNPPQPDKPEEPLSEQPNTSPQLAEAASAPPTPPTSSEIPSQPTDNTQPTPETPTQPTPVLNVPANAPAFEPPPEGYAITLAGVEADIDMLKDYKPVQKLRYFVEGKYYHAKGLELTAEDHKAVVEKIGAIRGKIAALDAAALKMSPKDLKKKQGELYQKLGDYVPYAFQMANLDILWAINVNKQGTQYVYSPGGPRTCNITVLSMALEGLGLTTKAFTGDMELMQMIAEHQQNPSERVDWASDEKKREAGGKKSMTAEDKAIHEDARKDFKNIKLSSLRFADFMQVAIIYFYLTSSDVLAGNKRAMGIGVGELKKMKLSKEAAQVKEFDGLVEKAHEMAASGILFSDNFRYYAQRLFGNIGTKEGSLNDKKARAEAAKANIPMETQVADYKKKAMDVLIPLLQEGKMIEISRPGHFIFLANVTDQGIVVKDVGSQKRKHETLDWLTAYQEGWLGSYVAYHEDPDAAKQLASEQTGRFKRWQKAQEKLKTEAEKKALAKQMASTPVVAPPPKLKTP